MKFIQHHRSGEFNIHYKRVVWMAEGNADAVHAELTQEVSGPKNKESLSQSVYKFEKLTPGEKITGEKQDQMRDKLLAKVQKIIDKVNDPKLKSNPKFIELGMQLDALKDRINAAEVEFNTKLDILETNRKLSGKAQLSKAAGNGPTESTDTVDAKFEKFNTALKALFAKYGIEDVSILTDLSDAPENKSKIVAQSETILANFNTALESINKKSRNFFRSSILLGSRNVADLDGPDPRSMLYLNGNSDQIKQGLLDSIYFVAEKAERGPSGRHRNNADALEPGIKDKSIVHSPDGYAPANGKKWYAPDDDNNFQVEDAVAPGSGALSSGVAPKQGADAAAKDQIAGAAKKTMSGEEDSPEDVAKANAKIDTINKARETHNKERNALISQQKTLKETVNTLNKTNFDKAPVATLLPLIPQLDQIIASSRALKGSLETFNTELSSKKEALDFTDVQITDRKLGEFIPTINMYLAWAPIRIAMIHFRNGQHDKALTVLNEHKAHIDANASEIEKNNRDQIVRASTIELTKIEVKNAADAKKIADENARKAEADQKAADETRRRAAEEVQRTADAQKAESDRQAAQSKAKEAQEAQAAREGVENEKLQKNANEYFDALKDALTKKIDDYAKTDPTTRPEYLRTPEALSKFRAEAMRRFNVIYPKDDLAVAKENKSDINLYIKDKKSFNLESKILGPFNGARGSMRPAAAPDRTVFPDAAAKAPTPTAEASPPTATERAGETLDAKLDRVAQEMSTKTWERNGTSKNFNISRDAARMNSSSAALVDIAVALGYTAGGEIGGTIYGFEQKSAGNNPDGSLKFIFGFHDLDSAKRTVKSVSDFMSKKPISKPAAAPAEAQKPTLEAADKALAVELNKILDGVGGKPGLQARVDDFLKIDPKGGEDVLKARAEKRKALMDEINALDQRIQELTFGFKKTTTPPKLAKIKKKFDNFKLKIGAEDKKFKKEAPPAAAPQPAAKPAAAAEVKAEKPLTRAQLLNVTKTLEYVTKGGSKEGNITLKGFLAWVAESDTKGALDAKTAEGKARIFACVKKFQSEKMSGLAKNLQGRFGPKTFEKLSVPEKRLMKEPDKVADEKTKAEAEAKTKAEAEATKPLDANAFQKYIDGLKSEDKAESAAISVMKDTLRMSREHGGTDYPMYSSALFTSLNIPKDVNISIQYKGKNGVDSIITFEKNRGKTEGHALKQFPMNAENIAKLIKVASGKADALPSLEEKQNTISDLDESLMTDPLEKKVIIELKAAAAFSKNNPNKPYDLSIGRYLFGKNIFASTVPLLLDGKKGTLTIGKERGEVIEGADKIAKKLIEIAKANAGEVVKAAPAVAPVVAVTPAPEVAPAVAEPAKEHTEAPSPEYLALETASKLLLDAAAKNSSDAPDKIFDSPDKEEWKKLIIIDQKLAELSKGKNDLNYHRALANIGFSQARIGDLPSALQNLETASKYLTEHPSTDSAKKVQIINAKIAAIKAYEIKNKK